LRSVWAVCGVSRHSVGGGVVVCSLFAVYRHTILKVCGGCAQGVWAMPIRGIGELGLGVITKEGRCVGGAACKHTSSKAFRGHRQRGGHSSSRNVKSAWLALLCVLAR